MSSKHGKSQHKYFFTKCKRPERSTDYRSTKSFYELEKQADQFCCTELIEEKQTRFFHVSYSMKTHTDHIASATFFAIHFVVRKELCNQLIHLGNQIVIHEMTTLHHLCHANL